MVPEKHHQSGLVTLAVVGNQLLQRLVALPHQGQELLRRPVRRLQVFGQLNGPLQIPPALGIAAVVLHGDIEEKAGFLRLRGPVDHLIIRLI